MSNGNNNGNNTNIPLICNFVSLQGFELNEVEQVTITYELSQC